MPVLEPEAPVISNESTTVTSLPQHNADNGSSAGADVTPTPDSARSASSRDETLLNTSSSSSLIYTFQGSDSDSRSSTSSFHFTSYRQHLKQDASSSAAAHDVRVATAAAGLHKSQSAAQLLRTGDGSVVARKTVRSRSTQNFNEKLKSLLSSRSTTRGCQNDSSSDPTARDSSSSSSKPVSTVGAKLTVLEIEQWRRILGRVQQPPPMTSQLLHTKRYDSQLIEQNNQRLPKMRIRMRRDEPEEMNDDDDDVVNAATARNSAAAVPDVFCDYQDSYTHLYSNNNYHSHKQNKSLLSLSKQVKVKAKPRRRRVTSRSSDSAGDISKTPEKSCDSGENGDGGGGGGTTVVYERSTSTSSTSTNGSTSTCGSGTRIKLKLKLGNEPALIRDVHHNIT